MTDKELLKVVKEISKIIGEKRDKEDAASIFAILASTWSYMTDGISDELEPIGKQKWFRDLSVRCCEEFLGILKEKQKVLK